MFSHKGKTRTNRHNLGLASFLSFVAGVVNVVGFMAVAKLTTNVTGHFAFFVDEVFKFHLRSAIHILLYIFFFFFGAFVSNTLVEITDRLRRNMIYIIPAYMEAFILLFVALFGDFFIRMDSDVVAFLLLFAMGLQNALVTSISHSVVRTTHLTGLFTDMGIEFSQLFFYKSHEDRHRLTTSIKLRLTIICLFFLGGVTGGLLYPYFGIRTLLLGTAILFVGLTFDYIKIKSLLRKRKH